MIKKLISISFLLLYLAFLILPVYPLMHYYFFSSANGFSCSAQQKSFSNGDHTKTGDIAYLSALMKSADDNQMGKKNQNPPPSTNNEISNLSYLMSGSYQLTGLFEGVPLHFKIFSETILNRPLQVLIPPPNSQA